MEEMRTRIATIPTLTGFHATLSIGSASSIHFTVNIPGLDLGTTLSSREFRELESTGRQRGVYITIAPSRISGENMYGQEPQFSITRSRD